MNETSSWLTVGATLFAVRFVASEAAMEKPSLREGKVVFPPVLGIRVLFGLGIPTFLYGASQVAGGDLRRDWLAFSVLTGIALCAFILWPGTIAVDKSYIAESRWFGVRKILIPWNDVDYVYSIPAEGSVEIVHQNGLKITHSRYHVAPDAFQDLLRKYCKKYIPAS